MTLCGLIRSGCPAAQGRSKLFPSPVTSGFVHAMRASRRSPRFSAAISALVGMWSTHRPLSGAASAPAITSGAGIGHVVSHCIGHGAGTSA